MRALRPNRLISALLFSSLLLALPAWVCAQEDTSEVPLGDVARSFRKAPSPSETVIDNDNLSKAVENAESRRAAGSSPVLALDPGRTSFHVSSPDVTCSLSFTAKTASPFSDPILNELPRTELGKLDGPATIDGDSLQILLHNGSSWDLREVVIGLTIVKRPEVSDAAFNSGQARIVPASMGGDGAQGQASVQKQPDVTVLLHVKGSAAPSITATFRTPLNFALFPDQEWHWAIVRAKGIPPQTSAEAMMTQAEPGSESGLLQPRDASSQSSPAALTPSKPEAASH